MAKYEQTQTVTDTDTEKLAAEQNLDAAIPDIVETVEGEAQSEATPRANPEKNLALILQVVPMGFALSGYVKTAEIWGTDTLELVSSKTIPVLEKYELGRKLISYLSADTNKEIADLVIVLAPLTLATLATMKAEKQQIEADKKTATNEPVKANATLTEAEQ